MNTSVWTQVEGLRLSELSEGAIVEAPAGDRTIALVLHNGQVHAFAPNCPHAGARLCDGWIDARSNIVCPVHKYRFSLSKGMPAGDDGYRLIIFPVELREGSIYVQFRKP
jgi:3-phenylpropionate/trans-cinnamate dioxygenase ferredoxin subunit